MVENYISVVSQIEMALKLQKMTKLQENDDVVKVLVKVGQHSLCIDKIPTSTKNYESQESKSEVRIICGYEAMLKT